MSAQLPPDKHPDYENALHASRESFKNMERETAKQIDEIRKSAIRETLEREEIRELVRIAIVNSQDPVDGQWAVEALANFQKLKQEVENGKD